MDAARETVARAFSLMAAERRPAAIIIRKGIFSPYSGRAQPEAAGLPTREAALGAVLKFLPPAGRVVSTTGMLSRELFELRERDGRTHDHDFLTVGAMGHASQIAFGLALSLPKVKIFCLDGDGALIMHMGGLASIGAAGLRNFTHIVFNNAAHDSVGGQATVAGELNLPQIALSCGYTAAARLDNLAGLEDRLAHYTKEPGCFFLEIRVAKGARKNLGRPGRPLPDCLAAFSKSCRLLEP
jgi:phosphonopyruvate decarboxylase